MPKANFTLNLMEQIDEIRAVLGEKKYRDSWGYECSQFSSVDDNKQHPSNLKPVNVNVPSSFSSPVIEESSNSILCGLPPSRSKIVTASSKERR